MEQMKHEKLIEDSLKGELVVMFIYLSVYLFIWGIEAAVSQQQFCTQTVELA